MWQVSVFGQGWWQGSWVLWRTNTWGQQSSDGQTRSVFTETRGQSEVQSTKTTLWFPSCDYVSIKMFEVLLCKICNILICFVMSTVQNILYSQTTKWLQLLALTGVLKLNRNPFNKFCCQVQLSSSCCVTVTVWRKDLFVKYLLKLWVCLVC